MNAYHTRSEWAVYLHKITEHEELLCDELMDNIFVFAPAAIREGDMEHVKAVLDHVELPFDPQVCNRVFDNTKYRKHIK